MDLEKSPLHGCRFKNPKISEELETSQISSSIVESKSTNDSHFISKTFHENYSKNLMSISYNVLLPKTFIIIFLIILANVKPLIALKLVRELEVSEGVPIGHRIGFIENTLNFHSNSEFEISSGEQYLIWKVSGSPEDTDLAFDLNTGEIKTKKQLDREKRAVYNVTALHRKTNEQIRISIIVLDENDNAPTFPQAVMTIEFPENTPRDVKRTLSPARDPDLGRNNTQRYNIVSGNVENAFRLSSHRERDGVLYVDLQINGFLDRETTPSYNLLIEAIDGGNPPLRGQMLVNITIQDVNDNQPIFNQSRYFAIIAENATIGSSVLQVYASDTDEGANGQVEYAINRRQSDKNQMFRIDSKTGLVTVNKLLDFENKELHELVVVAKDHGEQPLETTAFVSIRVTDINDNQPMINVIFLSDDATPKISESAQPGEFVARISVNDPDNKAEYNNVNVTLKGGDGHFGLTTRDNIIYLMIVNLPLDRESKQNVTINVVATDNGTPPLHASKTIYLRITDINDNAPEFERSVYYANVLEIADPGTSVLQVNAFDRDEGNNSAIFYLIADTPETHSQWFQIDTQTGLITTRSHIDCETEPVPQLTVIAKDKGQPPMSSTTRVLITIHDVNDNEPIFDQSFYNVSVSENEPVGRCFLKVSASDPDCGVNAVVSYSLGENTKHLEKFDIRSASGEICIAGELDYEKRISFEFPVIATDKGGLSSIAMVKIQLTDINDNRPIFYPREYNVSLREPVSALYTPIVSVVATDPDSGHFGAVTYRIVSGNEEGIFRIDRNSGEVFINRPNMISVRTQQTHVLNISASDGGGLRTSTDATVYLSIIDEKQRPPIFEKASYNFTIRENVEIQTFVGTVTASSGDSPLNNILYSIYSGDPYGFFGIDQHTGSIVTAKALDHEIQPQVLLNIQTTHGNPPSYGHTQVNIYIEDVNDNPPEFETSMMRISVAENVELGIPIYAANAYDRDSGKNGEVTYSLLMLSTPKSSSGSYSQLKNVRNNPMQEMNYRNHHYSIIPAKSILENRETSSDLNMNYQNNTHGHTNIFLIDKRSGHLTLSQHLDYETSKGHSLIVTATDGGEPKLSANLTIHVDVQDVNDNLPVFDRSEYMVKILESMPISAQILQVNAIDADTGNNARLTYSIVSIRQSTKNEFISESLRKFSTMQLNSNDSALANDMIFLNKENSALFGIFPNSGWIYLRGLLDREIHDRYELTVMASDNGTPVNHANTSVIVNVLDINDNDPKFKKSSYEFSIEENLRRGSFVGFINATDIDLDENADIQYFFIPTNTSFIINSITGEIVTRDPLNREEQAVFDLIAEARDKGIPPRSTRVSVKVHLTDVNDNAPDIVDPLEDLVSIREGQPIGTEVVRVRAIDRDNGVNASITYGIINGRDAHSLFSINPQSGVIRTRVVLDHEEHSINVLEVSATDGGTPPMQSKRFLRVEVFDVNDNRPTFTSSSLVFRVREDVTIGHVVGYVGPIEYADQRNFISLADDIFQLTITPLSNDSLEGAFGIDRNTGSLIVMRTLDREIQSEFRLKIQVLDTSTINNPQSSAITIKVEIADVNDNPPQWPEDPIEIKVSEDTKVGTLIYNFTASDADSGSNSDLQYKLLDFSPKLTSNAFQPDTSSLFKIDILTGALTLLAPLDFETITEYILLVQALDQSSNITERLNTTVTVIIKILDVNDNAPTFVLPSKMQNNVASISLPNSLRVGETVAHVVAMDKDVGDNTCITYALVGGNNEGFFEINNQTGYIVLSKTLPISIFNSEIYDNSRLNLIISASDNGKFPHSLQSLINVKLNIQKESRTPPRFQQAVYQASVAENAQTGTFVVQVSAKSILGLDDNVNLAYEIPLGIADNMFQVDAQRGIVTTYGQFDREVNAKYIIPIYVYDVNHILSESANDSADTERKQRSSSIAGDEVMREHFDIATIIVTISDINDHKPEFRTGSCYPLAVPENNNTTVIHTIVATDLDEAANGEIIYSIIGGNLGNKFSIDSKTGELKASPLDREQQLKYNLKIQAQDRGSLIVHKGHCNITIFVEDINDNTPYFEQSSYEASVIEDAVIGTSVMRIKATDLDSDINARLIYTLENETTNLFAIDQSSGIIRTNGLLDRERQAIYNFQVVATDGGRYHAHSARAPVQIIVDDINDNKPVFERYPYRAQVPALVQPGQALLQVTATDRDFGANGEVLYSLDIRNNTKDINLLKQFRINIVTGVISASQSLASAANRLLHIEILAYDKGRPSQSSVGVVELFIGGQSFESPTLNFQNETYRLKLREHTDIGTRLLKVNTIRSDGRRQDTQYSFIAGNDDGIFFINNTTGEISVHNSEKLDYESFIGNEDIKYNLLPMSSEFGIYENTSRQPLIDANFDDDIGMLKESRVLLLILMAQSNISLDKSLYAYAKLIIELADLNDNSPQFTQQEYIAAVWEGKNKGTFVLRINATDADAPNTLNSNLLYHIVDGNHENAFAIDQTSSGIVKTNIVLDREVRDMYKLKVIATDKGNPQRTGSAKIRIYVVDINDNQPTFPPHSVVNINEATELGTVITTISANDIDTYPAITYRLGEIFPVQEGNKGKKPLFSIDSYSGKVVLINYLDFERQKHHDIEIIASDTVHEVKTTLTVHVIDTNDNAPIFQIGNPHAYFALLSQPSVNTPTSQEHFELLVLNATDADGAGVNSQIHYSIEPLVEGFDIDELSGSLKVNTSALKNNMKKRSRNFFYILVVARDGGSPSSHSSIIVQVQMKKNQVSNTQLIQTQYRVQINEEAPIGTVLLKLNHEIIEFKSKVAIENQLVFTIVAGNEDGYFEILESSAIVLIKPLDRELNDVYKLRIAIHDMHSLPQQHYLSDNSTATISVIVNVEDANDNAPTFEKNFKYAAEISESAPLRYSIAKLTASDADQLNSPNTEVVYDITSGNDERMFAIDLLSGVLFVNNHLDFDTGANSYALTIRACDSAILPRCSLQLFNVILLDENDNSPQFPFLEQTEYVGENEPIGTRIFTAHATDLDRGIFGQVNYSIIQKESGMEDTLSKMFHIDNQTGAVSTNEIFDFELRESYDLLILAVDKGARSATVHVRIKIESRDEYAPQFTKSIYHFVLPMLSTGYVSMGYALGQVRAIDSDKGPDGSVVYQIRPQHKNFKINRTTGTITFKRKIEFMPTDERDLNFIIIASSGRQNSLESKAVVEITLDPLFKIGVNSQSNGDSYGPTMNWVLGALLFCLFVVCATAGIIFFTRMRKRKPQNTTKPHLNSETLGTLNSYISSNTLENISARTAGNNSGASMSNNNDASGDCNNDSNRFSSITVAGQISPPKYDEIPPYASHSSCSNSGPVTTSELSGSEQSGSSGRGSAEDDGEDEEICMINEGGPLHRCNGSSAAGGNSAISIEGRISDISVQNTQEYLARLGIVDRTSNEMCAESVTGSNKISHAHHTLPAMHIFDEDPNTESDITNLIYAKLTANVAGTASEHSNSTGDAALTVGSIEVALDHVMTYGDIQTVSGNVGPSMSGSLSSIIHSEEELTGSYNWDYLLDWGPQYQPLAHVFSEIARLKDDSLPEHCASNSKFRQSHLHSVGSNKLSIPPPLLTNITPCSINIPVVASNKMNLRFPSNKVHYHSTAAANAGGLQYMLPRSPINHDTPGDFTCSAAMSPSFSPSLSPLATRSPSISPLGIPGGQRKKNVV